MGPQITEKHPLWLRLVHWIGFPAIALMVWSGILVYWANDVYDGFFPAWFYRVFSIDHRLAEGMAVHFTIGWLLVADGTLFLLLSLVTGHWRELLPDRASARALVPTLLSELRLGPHVGHPGKYNAAQRFAYTGLVLIVVLEVLSGFAIYKPVQLHALAMLLGGHRSAHFIHFACMLAIVLFFLVHVTQVLRAGWNNFRSMVAGFELEDER